MLSMTHLFFALGATTEGQGIILTPGSHSLSASTSGQLLTIVSAGTVPELRSYDGEPWEQYARSTLTVLCTTACSVVIPEAGVPYELRSSSITTPTTDSLDARFLSQATFGPTQLDLLSLSNLRSTMQDNTPAVWRAWIQNQMMIQSSSLRAYYRKRVSPIAKRHYSVGSAYPACVNGSRWHRYAFSWGDKGKSLSVRQNALSQYELVVDGVIRTIVPDITTLGTAPPCSLTRVDEAIGGRVVCGGGEIANPVINFVSPDMSKTRIVDASDATLEPLTMTADAFVLVGLRKDAIACTSSSVEYLLVDSTYAAMPPLPSLASLHLTLISFMGSEWQLLSP